MVRLTDLPDMTLDVYRGRKTTIQLALKIPEKTPTQISMLTCNIGKERKMDENRKIRAMTLSLNPMIQSLILHMYISYLKILPCTVPEKTVTQI